MAWEPTSVWDENLLVENEPKKGPKKGSIKYLDLDYHSWPLNPPLLSRFAPLLLPLTHVTSFLTPVIVSPKLRRAPLVTGASLQRLSLQFE